MLKFIVQIYKGSSPAYAMILMVIGQLFVVAINIITGVITARFLGPEGRGILAAVNTLPLFLTSVASCGFPAAIVYFLRSQPHRRASIISSSIVVVGIMGVAATLAGDAAVPFVVGKYPFSVSIMTYWCAFWTTFSLYIILIRTVMISDGQVQRLNMFNCVSPVLYLLGLIAVVSTGEMTVWKVVLASTFTVPIMLIWMLFDQKKALHFHVRDAKTGIRDIASFSAKAAPIDIILQIIGYVDRFFLVAMVIPEQLGIYSVLFALSRIVSVLSVAISSVVYPAMNGRSNEEMKAIHDNVFRMSSYFVCIAVMVTFFIGSDVVGLIYGREYANHGVLLVLLVADAGLAVLGQLVVHLYIACAKPLFPSISQAISLAVVCAGLALLVPYAGIVGAGIALFLASFVRLIVLLLGLPRILNLAFPRFYPHKEDLAYGLKMLRK